jgi:hypothetical protein
MHSLITFGQFQALYETIHGPVDACISISFYHIIHDQSAKKIPETFAPGI